MVYALWVHSISDLEMENALKVRLDFLLFTGFDLGDTLPYESTPRFINTGSEMP